MRNKLKSQIYENRMKNDAVTLLPFFRKRRDVINNVNDPKPDYLKPKHQDDCS